MKHFVVFCGWTNLDLNLEKLIKQFGGLTHFDWILEWICLSDGIDLIWCHRHMNSQHKWSPVEPGLSSSKAECVDGGMLGLLLQLDQLGLQLLQLMFCLKICFCSNRLVLVVFIIMRWGANVHTRLGQRSVDIRNVGNLSHICMDHGCFTELVLN